MKKSKSGPVKNRSRAPRAPQPELSLSSWMSAMGEVFSMFLGGSDEAVLKAVGAAFNLLIQAQVVEKRAALSMLSVLRENMASARAAVRGLLTPSTPARATPPPGCFGGVAGVGRSDEALILAITELGKANERTAEIAREAIASQPNLTGLAPVALQVMAMMAEWSRTPKA